MAHLKIAELTEEEFKADLATHSDQVLSLALTSALAAEKRLDAELRAIRANKDHIAAEQTRRLKEKGK